MAERPILFSAPMVRAILDGRKTQTRRLVKFNTAGRVGRLSKQWHIDNPGVIAACPYGQVGDSLWVREGWQDVHPLQVAPGRYSQPGRAGIPGPPPVKYMSIYRADGPYPRLHFDHPDGKRVDKWPYRSACIGEGCTLRHVHPEESFTGWEQSNHMPRWASRITLEVTSVRVEKLKEISEDDAIAEGADAATPMDDRYQFERPHVVGFCSLWESINGAASWHANPWVWVIEFKRLEATHG